MLTRNECRSLSFAIENCHIFRLGQVRKHFLYVCRLRDNTHGKTIANYAKKFLKINIDIEQCYFNLGLFILSIKQSGTAFWLRPVRG